MSQNRTPELLHSNTALIFAPHNDDEILAAGGVIQQYVKSGTTVRIALMTNGDGQVRRPRIPPFSRQNFLKLGYIRQKETLAALDCLGLGEEDVEFFGYPDRGLSGMWTGNWNHSNLYYSKYTDSTRSPYRNSYSIQTPYCGSAVVEDVKRLMLEVKPEVVYLPHPNDLHPDHWATNGFVLYGLEQLKNEGYSEFKNVRMLSYLVHSLKYPRPRRKDLEATLRVPAHLEKSDTEWTSVRLAHEERQKKLRAIGKHKTQTRIMRQYLVSFARANELFGSVLSLSLENSAKYETAPNLSPESVKKEEHTEPFTSFIAPQRKNRLAGLKRYPRIKSVHLSKNSKSLNMTVNFFKKLRPGIEIQVTIKPFRPGREGAGKSHAYLFKGNRLYHNGGKIGNGDGYSFVTNRLCCRLSIPRGNIGDPCKLILSMTTGRRGIPFLRVANRLVKL